MRTQVVIDQRFCGPPGSANGGYACGVTAQGSRRPAEVTLLAPPPLQQPLTLEQDHGETRLLADDRLVAQARPFDGELNSPPTVRYDEALAAAESFDIAAYRRSHVYPTCYTCGPDRTPGDGLRIFPGATGGHGIVAWPWTPTSSHVDDGGAVDERVLWAALDCQSGFAWLSVDRNLGTIVLGRMAAVVHRRPRASEPLTVLGWTLKADGRKRHAGSAIQAANGELTSIGTSTWILLTPEQQRDFDARAPQGL